MTWTALHTKLDQTLKKQSSKQTLLPLLPKGSSILVAVSGGQDSVCLLKLLLDLQKKWQWRLGVAHCDHGWPTDLGMADQVETLAKNWELPYQLKVAVNLKETEAAAREWRYQSLIEIAKENHFPYLVTGHTQSDRAETLLYNLIRGSGSEGLTALSWQRQLTPDLQLVRPLLDISRAETGAFCQQLNLPVWQDEVNQNLHYARNRIRQEVIPYLQTHFNPQVEKNLAQTADILESEVDYLESLAQQLFESVFNGDRTQLYRPSLRSLPLALQRRLIRQFLQLNLPHAPNFEQIEALVNLISAPNRSASSSLPGNQRVIVQGDWLMLISTETSLS